MAPGYPRYKLFSSAGVSALKTSTHRYVESVAIRDLVVDDGLYIDRLQLELYGDVNKP